MMRRRRRRPRCHCSTAYSSALASVRGPARRRHAYRAHLRVGHRHGVPRRITVIHSAKVGKGAWKGSDDVISLGGDDKSQSFEGTDAAVLD